MPILMWIHFIFKMWFIQKMTSFNIYLTCLTFQSALVERGLQHLQVTVSDFSHFHFFIFLHQKQTGRSRMLELNNWVKEGLNKWSAPPRWLGRKWCDFRVGTPRLSFDSFACVCININFLEHAWCKRTIWTPGWNVFRRVFKGLAAVNAPAEHGRVWFQKQTSRKYRF